MPSNVGKIDKIMRVCLGLILIAVAVFANTVPYNWIGWVGVIPLLTGLLGYCPLYSLFGWSTCKFS